MGRLVDALRQIECEMPDEEQAEATQKSKESASKREPRGDRDETDEGDGAPPRGAYRSVGASAAPVPLADAYRSLAGGGAEPAAGGTSGLAPLQVFRQNGHVLR